MLVVDLECFTGFKRDGSEMNRLIRIEVLDLRKMMTRDWKQMGEKLDLKDENKRL